MGRSSRTCLAVTPNRVDPLVRAAEAVVRNIAEAAGRWSPADVAKHDKIARYRNKGKTKDGRFPADVAKHDEIARGEAVECAASLDVLKVRGLVDQARYNKGLELPERGGGMLTKLCR